MSSFISPGSAGSAHHAQFSIVQQGFAECAEVMGGPDQFGFVFHQAFEGEVAGVTHQLRSLFAGVFAGDAWLDAEQGVGVVFALVEDGLAWGTGGCLGWTWVWLPEVFLADCF